MSIFCRPAFQKTAGAAHHSLLVIQCGSGHLNADLIACARYRISDKRMETLLKSNKEGCTHVLFIIHLPRQVVDSMFVGFQADPWISTHIDDLRPTTDGTIILHEALSLPISQLFYGNVPEAKEGLEVPFDDVKMHIEPIPPQLPIKDDFEGGSGPHTLPPVVGKLFKRLHVCIQPSAARLQDSVKNKERTTKRVAILVSLIPSNPSFPIGV